MEKDRSSKVIAIVALLVAVVGLSVGFAAFTRNLNISSEATVSPENNMKVLFSTSATEQLAGTVAGEVTGTETTGASAGDANISSTDSTTITGLKANFTKPGQIVTYEFYAHNDGAYAAYLTNVTFNNVTGKTLPVVCTAKTGTTEALAQAACEDITISVVVGEGDDAFSATGSEANIADHELAMGSYEKVVVTISYPTGSAVSDGDFDVAFGDLTLTYSSVNPGA